MPLTVNGVCRYAFVATNGQRPVINIWDAKIDTTGTTTPRSEAIFRYAGVLLNSWKAQIMLSLHNGYVLQEIRWLDLDELTGPTGGRSSTSQVVLPQSGSVSGTPASPNTSVLVKKQTSAGRGSRNGRCYLSPLSEAQIDYFVVEQTSLVALQQRVNAFFADSQQTAAIADYNAELHVVHANAAQLAGVSPGTSSKIDNLVVEQKPATQRRRLRK